MNYFSHGYQYLDRPHFLIGTAIPDLLSVADRKVRLRSKRVEPFADGSATPHAEFAAGVLRHLHDDHWFHRSDIFVNVTEQLGAWFRAALPPDEGHRPGFLGHIVMELLLDSELIRRHPEKLHEYYRIMDSHDPVWVQNSINLMARDSTDRVAPLLPLFLRERFLWDYLDSRKLFARLNQVMRRIKLNQLPESVVEVLDRGRLLVATHADDLLTEQPQTTT